MNASTSAPVATAARSGAVKPAKTYVLDTNVLIHDPRSIYQFEENNVVIPSAVLEELDKIKGERDSERGRNAREVHRMLLELFPSSASMREGVKLPSGGSLLVSIPDDIEKIANAQTRAVFQDLKKKDNQILLTAVYVSGTFPPPTILVTKDANVALKARAIGLEAQDYRNDKVSSDEVKEVSANESLEVSEQEFQSFASSGVADLDGSDKLALNEYITISSRNGRSMPARAGGPSRLCRLRTPDFVNVPGGRAVKARNDEQRFLMDAMLDPTVKLLTVRGPAGTGKTLLSVATSLKQVMAHDGSYERLLISRPVVALGKDIGFLPGSMEEKMKPWLAPYVDALDFLFPATKPVPSQFAGKSASKRKHGKAKTSDSIPASHHGSGPIVPLAKPYERLLSSGIVTIEALTFIRGRSLANVIWIIDEAQNLTRHEIKTIVTRMSEGSKLILMGDEGQIDNPFLDKHSNGLIHAATRMRDLPYAAHITLTKCERSELAEDGAKLL